MIKFHDKIELKDMQSYNIDVYGKFFLTVDFQLRITNE